MAEQSPQTTTTNNNHTAAAQSITLPRITIQFCTQCKWMLRAAYFAQELLSTFSTDLGEVALVPVTGGVFRVTMYHFPPSVATGDAGVVDADMSETQLWDRKSNGGFPEVKHLKSLVRNIIDPSRDLGHTDRALRQGQTQTQATNEPGAAQAQPHTQTPGSSVTNVSSRDGEDGAAIYGKEQGKKGCEECQ